MTTETWLFISEFFGGLVLFFAIGYFIGHLLKLDKHLKEEENDNT
jgi:hypothetical protein